MISLFVYYGHFGRHCCRRVSPISIKHIGRHKYINFNIKFMNLLKLFDGGLDKGKGMCKATHPWGLHHHGGGVC